MSRNPDVIGAAHVITCAASVIGPIANLDRDGAWVAIARVTGITGSVRRISTIITSASAWTDRHRKEKEQENWPFWPGFRSIPGGNRLRFRVSVINNVHFHINHIRIRRSFTRLNSRTSALTRRGASGYSLAIESAAACACRLVSPKLRRRKPRLILVSLANGN